MQNIEQAVQNCEYSEFLKLLLFDKKDKKSLFLQIFSKLHKEKGIAIASIAKKMGVLPYDKFRQKLSDINAGRSSGNPDELIKLVEAYPDTALPVLGLPIKPINQIKEYINEESNTKRIEVLEEAIIDLRKRLGKLEDNA